LVLHRRLTTQSRGRLARTRKPPLTSNVRQIRVVGPRCRLCQCHQLSASVSMPCAHGRSVLASAPVWAVRPSAASARSVEAPAFFLPAWSHVGDHGRSPSAQEVTRSAYSSVDSKAWVSAASRLPRLAGQWQKQHCRSWSNLEHQMPEVSTRRRRASGTSSQSSSAIAVSRSCHPLVQPGSPNHSVKGTCLRQAPYVER